MKRLLIKNITEFEAVKAYVKNNKELMEKIALGALDCDLSFNISFHGTIYLNIDEDTDGYRILWDHRHKKCTDHYEFKDFVEFFNQIPKKSLTFHDLDIGDVFYWKDWRNSEVTKFIKIKKDDFLVVEDKLKITKGNKDFKGLSEYANLEVEKIPIY